jgi:hypothetical protein
VGADLFAEVEPFTVRAVLGELLVASGLDVVAAEFDGHHALRVDGRESGGDM